MSKRERQRETPAVAPTPGRRPSEAPPWLARLATLAGIGVLIYMSGSVLREAREGRKEMGDRLGALEGRVVQLASKVDAAARQQAPRSGPDPNRVYAIRTEGSPSRGAATAPVVIAEFSDFQ